MATKFIKRLQIKFGLLVLMTILIMVLADFPQKLNQIMEKVKDLNLSKKGVNLHLNEKLIKGEPYIPKFPCPEPFGVEYSCQYYTPPWKNQTDIKSVLDKRLAKVKERCQTYYPHFFNTSLSSYGRNHSVEQILGTKQFLLSHKLKLAFCWMAKMSSIFWKRAWSHVENSPNLRGDLSHIKHFSKPLGVHEVFKQYGPGSDEPYLLFTITRNPWDRLVSNYREKCRESDGYKCHGIFAKPCGVRKTFQSFLRCILDTLSREEFIDPQGHVDQTYNRCGVCDVSYTYIVSLENMAKEAEYILKRTGLINPSKVLEKERRKTIRFVEKKAKQLSYAEEYWKKVPKELIDEVRFYYRYEIFLYDYPETPFYIEKPQK